MPILWNILTALLAFLGQQAAKAGFVLALAFLVFASLWLFTIDLYIWIFIKFLDLASYVLRIVGVSPADFDFMHHVRQLSPEMKNIAALVGFKDIMRNILMAMSIRFGMDCLPFMHRIG